MSARLTTALATFVVGVSIVVSGCAASSGAPPAHARQASKSIPQNVLTEAYPKDFTNLDPAAAFASENDILPEIYQTLTVFDVATGKLIPGLATSWSDSSGGTVWTFHLRTHVKFQDGEPLTATAVRLSYERTKQLNQGAAFLLANVTAITAINRLTVQVTLSTPTPFATYAAGEYAMYIVSPESATEPTTWFQNGHGFGTGPYEWVSYKHEQSAILKRFPGYWGGWHAGQFTRIVFDITPNSTTRAQEVASGQAQLTFNLTLQTLRNFAKRKTLKVVPLNIQGIQYMEYNTKRPPLNNPLVRQALTYAFPEEQIAKTIYGKYGTQNSTSYIPKGLYGYTTSLKGYSFDLSKARSLLAQAGYPHGGFTINYAYLTAYPEQLLLTELWKTELAKLGVTLDIQTISFNALIASIGSPLTAADSQMEYWFPSYPGPLDFIGSMFTSTGGGNIAFWGNPQVDSLFAQATRASINDQAAARADLIAMQRILFANVPGFPVVDEPETFVASSSITGFKDLGFGMDLYNLRTKQ